MIGRDDADRNDVLRSHDHGVGRHRHHRVEVAGGQHIGEIAEVIGQKGVNKRELSAERGLQQVRLAVDLDLALAFGNQCADARRRQYAAETAAPGANALGERTLRNQIDRDLIGQHLLLRLRIEADMGRGQTRDQSGIE